jgi:hypothetical protein
MMLPRLLDSVGPVHSLADHFNISLGMKYLADASTHTFIVIHHQHAKGAPFHRVSRRNSSKPFYL